MMKMCFMYHLMIYEIHHILNCRCEIKIAFITVRIIADLISHLQFTI